MSENTIVDLNSEIPKNPSSVNIAVKWALVAILLSVIHTMVNLYLNDGKFNPRQSGIIQMVISLFIVFFPLTMAIKEYKDKEMDGFISFGRAFKTGFTFSLFNVLFSLLFFIIFYNFIIDFDTFMSEQMDIGIQAMKERGMSDEKIQSQMKLSPAFLTSQSFSLSMIVFVGLFFNTIATLIVAAILKRNRPTNA